MCRERERARKNGVVVKEMKFERIHPVDYLILCVRAHTHCYTCTSRSKQREESECISMPMVVSRNERKATMNMGLTAAAAAAKGLNLKIIPFWKMRSGNGRQALRKQHLR
jgi:hypothetical protein